MQCGGVIKSVFDLGAFALSGIFPNQEALSSIKVNNLNLGICNQCDLVQLTDYVEPNSYFTKNYGYESSLNLSMKLHLQKKNGEFGECLLRYPAFTAKKTHYC